MTQNKCKHTITILIVLSFLCQNFAWAYGVDSLNSTNNKLAKDSELNNKKFVAVSKALAGIVTQMRQIIKSERSYTDIELKDLTDSFLSLFTEGKTGEDSARYKQNIRFFYDSGVKSFYMYSHNPRNGPGVAYRIRLKKGMSKYKRDPYFGEIKPFYVDKDSLEGFEIALFTRPLPSKGTGGSANSVWRAITTVILLPILFFMWLGSPLNIGTTFGQEAPGPSITDVRVKYSELFNALDELGRIKQRESITVEAKPMVNYYNAGGEYDSSMGSIGFFNQTRGPWNGRAILGAGNSAFGFDNNDLGLGGLIRLDRDLGRGMYGSVRGGRLPTDSPVSTDVGLVGLYLDNGLAGNIGFLNRQSNDPANASGFLLNAGYETDIPWNLVLTTRGSAVIYTEPSATTPGGYMEVVRDDLSYLGFGLRNKDGSILHYGGEGVVGGLLNRNLPFANSFSSLSGYVGPVVNVGPVRGGVFGQVEWANPSNRPGGLLAGLSTYFSWWDYFFRFGVRTGPDYASPFYLGLGGTFGPGALPRELVSPLELYPVQEFKGPVMDELHRGPGAPAPTEVPLSPSDELREAEVNIADALVTALTSVGDANTAVSVYDEMKDELNRLGVSASSRESYETMFWNAFFKNPNINLYWIPIVRTRTLTDIDPYKLWHRGGSKYIDIIEKLLRPDYIVNDEGNLDALIFEFDRLMAAVAEEELGEKVLLIINPWLDEYLQRLSQIQAGNPKSVFTFYVASRLFTILINNNMYPGDEKLAKLVEAKLKMPQDVTAVQLGIDIPNSGIIEELNSNVRGLIKSNDINDQVRGLLILEFLLDGGYVKFSSLEDIFGRLYGIFKVPGESALEPVPINPTEDSEYILRFKTAMIALDILLKNGGALDAEFRGDIAVFLGSYRTLDPKFREKIRMRVLYYKTDDEAINKMLRDAVSLRSTISNSIQKFAGVAPAFVLSVSAGLFLTGCSGTGIGAVGAMVILLILSAVVAKAGNPSPRTTEETHGAPGAKAVRHFNNAVFRIGDKKTIVALNTEIGNLSDRNSPARPLLDCLKKGSRIEFVEAKGIVNLLIRIKDTIGSMEDVNVVIICKNTDRENLNELESSIKGSLFIATINNSEIKKSSYIPILEIIALSLQIASGAGMDEIKELYKEITNEELTQEIYDAAKKGLSIILREIERYDLEKIYGRQADLISQSA